MAGGKIANNTAAGEGGAVSVANNGNFKMTAGEISGNTAGRGSVMAFFRGTYTNNGVTISLDVVDGQRVITITDAEGNNLEYVLDVDDGSRITAGDIPEGMNLYYWDKVLQLIAPVPETPETPEIPDVPGSMIIPDADALLTGGSDTTIIEDEEIPLAGLVSTAQLLEELREYEGIEDMELPEDFQWLGLGERLTVFYGELEAALEGKAA